MLPNIRSEFGKLSTVRGPWLLLAAGPLLVVAGVTGLVVSGGKSPTTLFQALRVQELDWSRICIALADERWVDPSDPASNEKLVRDVLRVNLQSNIAPYLYLALAVVAANTTRVTPAQNSAPVHIAHGSPLA